ncbi:potassium transporter Kup [Blastopirellula marina]|uniref:Probable potassium transport system protein Kup n=1 Tax=Blastopirellula marina TaxID=124 RepID=A0A2S8GR76_9BACT|nr:potassium transporter Kup [Blastopirellula marina]PQO26484.1 potassium transporter Kup [Blastopirellula marina]PQO46881.1 potassium transporter Kup [Blastopirellula marina]PTL40797.1 potassium transporter Kup [Blastopirellula marina]
MSGDQTTAEKNETQGSSWAKLSLVALGVVYGDIGTSPLYALRECFRADHAIAASQDHVLGVLSLIFWALAIVISTKYLIFILQADNEGEGGILALAALVSPSESNSEYRRWAIFTLGLLGGSLLYADGMITPAISVLSAIEGLEIAAPALDSYVEPITIAILVGLFLFQSRGTASVGTIFGPIMLIWFFTLAGLGILHLVQAPQVLTAINPIYGIRLLFENQLTGFLVLGSVFLVVTGGEALYADMGHFGKQPIRISWYWVVLPSLLLNYFGQGAFLLRHPEGFTNPFYLMAPGWALYPLVVLATLATVIASQAVITGAFSLTLQAVQLGYSPRMTIRHTSAEQIGQIYIPLINWVLMFACIGLVLGFRSSDNLAAAYGVAVTITMVITTVLFFLLTRMRWNWSLPAALTVSGIFLAVDLAFLAANLFKISNGGWFPLLVAAGAYTLMSTWMSGQRLLARRIRERALSVELYIADLMNDPPVRVPGIAIFLTSNPIGTPPALRHNVRHNKVLHEQVVFLTVSTAGVPHVRLAKRVEYEEIGEGFHRIMVSYGFMDTPNIPLTLATLPSDKLNLQSEDVTYYLGTERLLATARPGLAIWRERLFAWMARNSQPATAYFSLPPDQVVEIGSQVEL